MTETAAPRRLQTLRSHNPFTAETPSPVVRPPLDFAALVGDGWLRLHPDIRRRFGEKPGPDRPICYVGTMQTIEASAAGLVFAQLCRLIGTPFAPYRGKDVPVVIQLSREADDAIVWDRDYHYAGRPPIRVSSTKRADADAGLLECIGFGLGMRLAVFEANRALHFLSLRYFCTCFGRRIPLPRWLSPGTAHVVHTDLGRGDFRFTLTLHHALFGTLFHQDGVFHRSESSELSSGELQ